MLGLQNFLILFVRTSSATLEMQPQEKQHVLFPLLIPEYEKMRTCFVVHLFCLFSGTMNVKHMRKRRKTPNSPNFNKAETCVGTCCECFHSWIRVFHSFADICWHGHATIQNRKKTQELVQVPSSWTCRDMSWQCIGINGRTTTQRTWQILMIYTWKLHFHSWKT